MIIKLKGLLRETLGIKNRYLAYCFRYDRDKYATYSSMARNDAQTEAAKIRILCHTIEKALSLSDCRADFGVKKIQSLLKLLLSYSSKNVEDLNAIQIARSTIYKYVQHRQKYSLDVSFIPPEFFNKEHDSVLCGAMPYIWTQNDFKDFPTIANARHSVRNYSTKPVTESDIVRAMSLAQTAPSACNRQATKIYAITNPEKINAIKQRHGGIRTFGQPGVIFAITQDLNLYMNEYERNTWLVDGGIFCMNLLYALNSVGIVNCPVIWGGMADEDKFLSDIAGIPDNERTVILVIGGYAPEQVVKTPCSPKRPVGDILKVVD